MKLSTDKVSLPGAKQVFRLRDREGRFSRDVIGLHDEGLPGGAALLQPAMADGRRTGPEPTLEEIRQRFQQDFQCLDDPHKGLHNPPYYPVAISPRLERLTSQVQERILAADPAAPFPSPTMGEGQDGGEGAPGRRSR
jgi:nicotinate phosphoribosyltransferase